MILFDVARGLEERVCPMYHVHAVAVSGSRVICPADNRFMVHTCDLPYYSVRVQVHEVVELSVCVAQQGALISPHKATNHHQCVVAAVFVRSTMPVTLRRQHAQSVAPAAVCSPILCRNRGHALRTQNHKMHPMC